MHLTSEAMLARLVGLNTVSCNSNLELIGMARAWLEAHGACCRLSYDPPGRKANLHAILGPVGPGGLAFAGHVDTVSADGQSWSGDPFTLRRRDGRLIGRGACDMKGFVASLLAAVPDIAALPLLRPVHVLLTYDEEVGYHGARRLIADLAESGLRPASCVVGEPSGMRPILAQKGRLVVEVTVRGEAAHSCAAHRAVNAVHAASEAIAWLAAQSRRHAMHGPVEPGFDPPYTTLQVLDIASTGLPSTVPGSARFSAEWRNIPADDPKQELARFLSYVAGVVEPEMRMAAPEAGFAHDIRLELAALVLPPEHELARTACAVTGVKAGGKVSYCSEGSLYQPAGMACMICGPGDVSQVHQPDEWIAESQLAACDRFIRAMVQRMAAQS